MTKPAELVLGVLLGALCLAACTEPAAEGGTPASTTPAPAKPLSTWKPPPPREIPAVMPCDFDAKEPGPMQRSGRARVHLEGPGVSIDVSDVPALCGPLFNADVDALDIKAGEGLLFEVCLPQGTLRVSADGRTIGKQAVHAGQFPRGTDVMFDDPKGATYSTRGAASDSVVLSADLWRVDADVVLQEIDSAHELHAKISYDCSEKPAPTK